MSTRQQKSFFTRVCPEDPARYSLLPADCFLDELSISCEVCLQLIHNCLTVGGCSHKFCGACLLTWMKDNNSCPKCRNTVLYLAPDAPFQDIISQYSKKYPLRERTPEEQREANRVELTCLENMMGRGPAANDDDRLRQLRQQLARLPIEAMNIGHYFGDDSILDVSVEYNNNSFENEESYMLAPQTPPRVEPVEEDVEPVTPPHLVEVARPPTPYPSAEQIRQAGTRQPLPSFLEADQPQSPDGAPHQPMPVVAQVAQPQMIVANEAVDPRLNADYRHAFIARIRFAERPEPPPIRMFNIARPAVVDAPQPPMPVAVQAAQPQMPAANEVANPLQNADDGRVIIARMRARWAGGPGMPRADTPRPGFAEGRERHPIRRNNIARPAVVNAPQPPMPVAVQAVHPPLPEFVEDPQPLPASEDAVHQPIVPMEAAPPVRGVQVRRLQPRQPLVRIGVPPVVPRPIQRRPSAALPPARAAAAARLYAGLHVQPRQPRAPQ